MTAKEKEEEVDVQADAYLLRARPTLERAKRGKVASAAARGRLSIRVHGSEEVSKLLITEKKIAKLELDPHRETADVDIENNYFPRRIRENKFRLNKSTRPGNPLRDKQRADEKAKREAEKKKQEEDKKKN